MPTYEGRHQLTRAEVKQLCDLPVASLNDVVAMRDRCLLLLLSSTGMRISELARIDTRDVVQISKKEFAIANVRRGPHVPARIVPISKKVYEAIQDWLYSRPLQGPYLMNPTQAKVAGSLWWDAPLDKGIINATVARYGNLLGLDHLCVYDLRCYAAREFNRRGFGLAYRMLGHLHPVSTAKMLHQEADEVIDTNHLY